MRAGERTRDQLIADMLIDFDEREDYVRRAALMQRRIENAYMKATAAVDRNRMAGLQEFYRRSGYAVFQGLRSEHDDNDLDIARALRLTATTAVKLRLDTGPSLRILDLSMGAGHLAFVASQFGHRTVGIDEDIPTFGAILEMYGLERVVHTIAPGGPLPISGRFDLIAALRPIFGRHAGPDGVESFWSIENWIAFVEYLSTIVTYPGRIHLSMSYPELKHLGTTDDLMDLCEENGASVNQMKRAILFQLNEPLRLAKRR
jgi:hypothetical protein